MAAESLHVLQIYYYSVHFQLLCSIWKLSTWLSVNRLLRNLYRTHSIRMWRCCVAQMRKCCARKTTWHLLSWSSLSVTLLPKVVCYLLSILFVVLTTPFVCIVLITSVYLLHDLFFVKWIVAHIFSIDPKVGGVLVRFTAVRKVSRVCWLISLFSNCLDVRVIRWLDSLVLLLICTVVWLICVISLCRCQGDPGRCEITIIITLVSLPNVVMSPRK